MGYTHYWTFQKPKRGQASQNEKNYQLAIRQCQRMIRALNAELKREDEKNPSRLSGYSVHTKVTQYGGLFFNGTAELGHEPFVLREHFSQNESFNFCKTAQKPYDLAVTACLIVLKHYLGETIDVSSDGQGEDWTDGLTLAKRLTKIKGLVNPIAEKQKFKLIG